TRCLISASSTAARSLSALNSGSGISAIKRLVGLVSFCLGPHAMRSLPLAICEYENVPASMRSIGTEGNNFNAGGSCSGGIPSRPLWSANAWCAWPKARHFACWAGESRLLQLIDCCSQTLLAGFDVAPDIPITLMARGLLGILHALLLGQLS